FRAADRVYLGLYALQHRGQESCGIALCDDGVFRHKKGDGLVNEVFGREQLNALGEGNIAIGHVRYSTTGGSNHSNIQPLVVRHIKGNLALAHNGNLTNAEELRRSFELSGAIFHGTSDTEAISYKIVSERLNSASTEEAVEKAMRDIKGAYSCLLMTATKLIAFRDPNGFRPLVLGKNESGWAVASESCAVECAGYEFVRDILPGEIVTIDETGVHSCTKHCGKQSSLCVFEYIYFARPDSAIEGASVHEARKRAGRFLAKESPVDADMVIGVPDSGIDAALGYSEESGIPYGIGFVKNKYIGRSFIKPEQSERENTVRIKLNAIRPAISGKRIVMIDDSIVRGTTSERIVRLLRDSGAAEVHVRISSPPFRYPCYFGTDVDSQENLIACSHSLEEIRDIIGADSLAYLSEDAVKKLAPEAGCGFCCGCFTGEYPVPVPDMPAKNKFEEKIHKDK
ncbi:MAG: amidophosphoribosyltransferase, partial [Oscillospiraceae bacterium]